MENEKVLWEMAALRTPLDGPVKAGLFEKELLRVGRWVHPAKKFILEVTRERLARWVRNFRRMLEKGISVPVPYGHSYDARDNAGFVRDMRVEGDRLVGVLEIPREEDAARLGAVATDVSVSVNPDFADGQGERYGEVIEHVAITNYPVVAGQANFVALDAGAGAGVIRLEMVDDSGESAQTAADEPAAVEAQGDSSRAVESAPDAAAACGRAPGAESVSDDHDELLRRIGRLEDERVDREVESLLFSGKIAPAVEGHVRRIFLAGEERIQLSSTGESVSVGEEMRAIFAAMPENAWVPLDERAAAARALVRRDVELTDDRARKLARENASLLRKGGADGDPSA